MLFYYVLKLHSKPDDEAQVEEREEPLGWKLFSADRSLIDDINSFCVQWTSESQFKIHRFNDGSLFHQIATGSSDIVYYILIEIIIYKKMI